MDLEKLMQKKITRKQFLKSTGFIILALILFPRKALSFLSEKSYMEQKIIKKGTNQQNISEEIIINGVKVMELTDD